MSKIQNILNFKVVTLIFLGVLFNSCSLFEQRDLIISKEIYSTEEAIVYYDLYQTGLDNFAFEFFIVKSDTTKLFEEYLNDAVYKSVEFNCSYENDTIKIKSNRKIDSQSKILPDGTTIILY